MKGVSPLRRSPRVDHIMEELVWVETMWDLWDHAQIGTGDAEDMKHHHEMVIDSIRCVGDCSGCLQRGPDSGLGSSRP